MIGPLAVLLLAAGPEPAPDLVPFEASTSTRAPPQAILLVPPTAAPRPGGDRAAVRESARRGFERYFQAEAEAPLVARGFEWLGPRRADEALTMAGSGARCDVAECYTRAARAAGATHWLGSVLVEDEGACAARVVLFDIARAEKVRQIEDVAAPCDAESLLALARSLGGRVAAGPPRRRRVGVSLTPRDVPELGIADLPELEPTLASTSTQAERTIAYRVALDVYAERHLIAFEQDQKLYLSQNRKLLTECEAWSAAWRAHHAPLELVPVVVAPLPAELSEHCYGNHWEWAWLGVPTGAVIAWGSWGDLTRGEMGGVAGFVLGLTAAAVGAGLALGLDTQDIDPEDARYVGSWTEVEALVKSANAALRRRLQLSDADVLMAGMRL